MRLLLLLCTVACAALAFAEPNSPASAIPEKPPPLRVGVEVSSTPLSFLPDPDDPDSRPTGFTPELLREIERVSTLRFELVARYWTPNLADFEAGNLDMLGNVVRIDARRDRMAFTNPHARVHGVIYTRRDRPALSRTTDFAGRNIGTLAGSVAYVNALRHEGWGATITPFLHWEAALEATAKGETDGTLLLSPASSRLTNPHNLRIEMVGDILHDYHFALQPGSHVAVADLNDALATLTADGTLDRLVARWIGPIEPRPIRPTDLRPYLWPSVLGLLLLALGFSWQRRVLRQATRNAAALRRATELLNASQNLAQVGGWEVDLATKDIFWSEGTRRIHEVDTQFVPTLDVVFLFSPPPPAPSSPPFGTPPCKRAPLSTWSSNCSPPASVPSSSRSSAGPPSSAAAPCVSPAPSAISPSSNKPSASTCNSARSRRPASSSAASPTTSTTCSPSSASTSASPATRRPRPPIYRAASPPPTRPSPPHKNSSASSSPSPAAAPPPTPRSISRPSCATPWPTHSNTPPSAPNSNCPRSWAPSAAMPTSSPNCFTASPATPAKP